MGQLSRGILKCCKETDYTRGTHERFLDDALGIQDFHMLLTTTCPRNYRLESIKAYESGSEHKMEDVIFALARWKLVMGNGKSFNGESSRN